MRQMRRIITNGTLTTFNKNKKHWRDRLLGLPSRNQEYLKKIENYKSKRLFELTTENIRRTSKQDSAFVLISNRQGYLSRNNIMNIILSH